MNDITLIKEEIKEQEEDIFRLRGSMQRADNGVKLHRIAVRVRTVSRLKDILAVLENRRASA
ncbi:hypothetical protein KYK29_10295 [Shinella daejeonensis]|uniref:hypothetical protein n=1 Tax=Shinella daejeonensis TaxID=659017 RepID=UPI0020C77F15|nr:hypothetical protein [Shinella daejeonensis]MCP8895323.1 hypothetical protein [Shinella daejeonensis]